MYKFIKGEEKLHISDINDFEFVEFCLKEFRKNFDEWTAFSIFEQTEEEFEKVKQENSIRFLKIMDEIEKYLRK